MIHQVLRAQFIGIVRNTNNMNTEELLKESTRVAQEAAKSIGGTFEQGKLDAQGNVTGGFKTIISPKAADEAIEKAKGTASMMSPIPPEKTEEKPKIEKPEPLTLINPETLLEEQFTDPSLNKQRIRDLVSMGYQVSGGTLPVGITKDGKVDENVERLDQAKQEVEDNYSKLKNLDVINDPAFQSIAKGIESTWNRRIADMEQINKSRAGQLTQLGQRLGARYVASGGVQQGIVSIEETQGVNRIADLENEKNAALAQAQNAFRTQKWNEYVDLINIAEKRYEAQLSEVEKLNKTATEENKKIEEQVRISSLSTSVADLFDQGIKEPTQILNLINEYEDGTSTGANLSAKELGDMLDVFEKEEESAKMTNDIIEYNFAKDQGYDGDFLSFINEKKQTTPTTPSEIIEYQYAKSQGFEGSFMDYKKAGQSEKAPSSAQYTAAGYAERIEQAKPILDKLEGDIVKMNPISFEAQIFADKPYLQSDTIQQYAQASRNFINAQLRRESGAVISPTEFSEARKQYLPVPGDGEEVLAQKKQNRQAVYDNLKRAAGNAYEPVSDLVDRETIRATSPDGKTIEWDELTEEERRTLEDGGYVFE